MKSLFYQGGSVFMGFLTLILLALVVWNVYHLIVYLKAEKEHMPRLLRQFKRGKDIGLFGLIVGVMGQMVGLSAAFSSIQHVEVINHSLLAGGIRVTMITPIYGMLIFLISLLVRFVMMSLVEGKMER